MTTRMRQCDYDKKLKLSLAELGICVRTCNALEERGILTAADLLACCPHTRGSCELRCICRECVPLTADWEPLAYLRDIGNFGDGAVQEVLTKLREHGFG